jgi:sulfite exporter TauE/SafE
MWWTSAFVVGFLGSFHCIGMCGPIAMALPVGTSGVVKGRMYYNAGRILTYAVLGWTAGLLGHLFISAGFQRGLSITAGIVLLSMVLIQRLIHGFSPESLLYRWTAHLKSLFRKMFGRRGALSLFLIGLVNGLLPCGFVFIALAAAATSVSAMDGLLYMILFGLGTAPAMFALSLAVPIFPARIRGIISSWTPYVSFAIALLLLYRGITLEPNSCCKHP